MAGGSWHCLLASCVITYIFSFVVGYVRAFDWEIEIYRKKKWKREGQSPIKMVTYTPSNPYISNHLYVPSQFEWCKLPLLCKLPAWLTCVLCIQTYELSIMLMVSPKCCNRSCRNRVFIIDCQHRQTSKCVGEVSDEM